MTSPDIRERAERLWHRELGFANDRFGSIDLISQALASEREAGRAEERERAAKLADACLLDIRNNPHDFGSLDNGGIRAAEKIATAIRNPET